MGVTCVSCTESNTALQNLPNTKLEGQLKCTAKVFHFIAVVTWWVLQQTIHQISPVGSVLVNYPPPNISSRKCASELFTKYVS